MNFNKKGTHHDIHNIVPTIYIILDHLLFSHIFLNYQFVQLQITFLVLHDDVFLRKRKRKDLKKKISKISKNQKNQKKFRQFDREKKKKRKTKQNKQTTSVTNELSLSLSFRSLSLFLPDNS